ncbi:unnamed protein product, partial [Phaeothamnion confervicola]
MAITAELVLEATGEARLEDVSQLLLRGQGLASFDAGCAARLGSLAVLSLSNNAVSSLNHFTSLTGLVELNLNFNALINLRGLERCGGLRRLYLSNNLLATDALAALAAFAELRTLCLFRNRLENLPEALGAFRRLVKLREVDLDGNPCARCEGYRPTVVRALSRLEELDGESVTSLDRELAEFCHAAARRSA